MPRRALPDLLALLALSLVACGYQDFVSPVPGGGGGGGDDAGAGGADAAPSCESFVDDEPEETVVFRVGIETKRLYFPIDCERLSGRTISAEDGSSGFEIGPCDLSCELEQRPPVPCGDCPSYVLRLEPGATFTDVWDGLHQVPVTMPADCFHGGSGDACDRLEIAERGIYEVSVLAYPECPACDCDDDGRCTGTARGVPLRATSRFEFPRPGGDPVGIWF